MSASIYKETHQHTQKGKNVVQCCDVSAEQRRAEQKTTRSTFSVDKIKATLPLHIVT